MRARNVGTALGSGLFVAALLAACGTSGPKDQSHPSDVGAGGNSAGGSSSSVGGKTGSTGGHAGASGKGGAGGSSAGGKSGAGGTSNAGGASNAGGTSNTGGTNNVGGSHDTGGTNNTGGSQNAGGTHNTGGSNNTGGTTNQGGQGGSTSAGGTNIGGTTSAGGTDNTGGTTSTGGTDSTGGTTSAGGTDSTGGTSQGTGGNTGGTNSGGKAGSTTGTGGIGGTNVGGAPAGGNGGSNGGNGAGGIPEMIGGTGGAPGVWGCNQNLAYWATPGMTSYPDPTSTDMAAALNEISKNAHPISLVLQTNGAALNGALSATVSGSKGDVFPGGEALALAQTELSFVPATITTNDPQPKAFLHFVDKQGPVVIEIDELNWTATEGSDCSDMTVDILAKIPASQFGVILHLASGNHSIAELYGIDADGGVSTCDGGVWMPGCGGGPDSEPIHITFHGTPMTFDFSSL